MPQEKADFSLREISRETTYQSRQLRGEGEEGGGSGREGEGPGGMRRKSDRAPDQVGAR